MEGASSSILRNGVGTADFAFADLADAAGRTRALESSATFQESVLESAGAAR